MKFVLDVNFLLHVVPRTYSYVDICRLHIITENDTINSLKTLDCNSDYDMNTENENFRFLSNKVKLVYNHKCTNWKKF